MNPTQNQSHRFPVAHFAWGSLSRRVLATARALCLLGWIQVVAFSSQVMAAPNTDDFNDNSKNTSKWGADAFRGHAALTERNQRLEYTCNGATIQDEAVRPWVLTRFPYNSDWEIQVDTFNTTTPNQIIQVNSMGIDILSPSSDLLYVELYSSALGGLPSRTGFFSELETDGVSEGIVDQEGGSGVTNGAVRMAFNSTTKVISVFYDVDASNGYQWVQFGSFGLAGAGGADANTDWGLSDSDQFSAVLTGFSDFMTVTSGQMFLDNFMETGGVTPSSVPFPEPLGSFQFRFPTNNPLVARIVSVAGNYQGVSPTSSQRNYNMDVAEDESGKLSVLATVDGILDKTGSAQLSGNASAVKTVNGQPTAQLKGSFSGTRDGVSVSSSGKAVLPVEVVDVGGGTNGISGTGTYSSKVGGVPFSGRNLPLQLAAPPGAVDNLKQDWTLQLDLNRKLVGTKERGVASAQLILPNGDTLHYRERTIKYSATRGYTLSFTRGTNVTVNPFKIDKKSSITIKRLTFVKQGADWEPTGGTILYRFLGQKGTANLMDFVE